MGLHMRDFLARVNRLRASRAMFGVIKEGVWTRLPGVCTKVDQITCKCTKWGQVTCICKKMDQITWKTKCEDQITSTTIL